MFREGGWRFRVASISNMAMSAVMAAAAAAAVVVVSVTY
jgi:hypothetical protein